jgi:hypothetical protein
VKPKNFAVHRDMLNEASELVCHLIDDESQPDEVRDKAATMQYWLSEVLCYQDHSAEGERSLRVVPIGFKWPNFYSDMADELVLDLYGRGADRHSRYQGDAGAEVRGVRRQYVIFHGLSAPES